MRADTTRGGWGILGGLLVAGMTLGVGCDGQDVTTLLFPEVEGQELEPSSTESRTVTALAAPESTDLACRWLGVASGADIDGCLDVVAQCRANVADVFGGPEPSVDVPSGDLEELLGCPLTYAQLDGCIGSALERGVEAYGDQIECDQPSPPPLESAVLFASPECLAVALFCPQLIEGLTGQN